jgi:Transposase
VEPGRATAPELAAQTSLQTKLWRTCRWRRAPSRRPVSRQDRCPGNRVSGAVGETFTDEGGRFVGVGQGGSVALSHPTFSSPQIFHRGLARPPVPSSRTITSWIMRSAEKLNEDDTAAIKDACTRCPDIAIITELAGGFTELVRQRRGAQLEDWMAKACAGPIAEIRGFASGLRKDFDAVKAGLTLAWSSGAVEGAVNRVKMVKRQMFGRANFDLLRKRILVRDHPDRSITT